ncbi:MAG: type II toxin-antitoxin system RelE/ParE family toxin [Desulfovibrionales bacterium]|nr:MAG: type II toxin-antitoxin system RelE/ParE family toxin [Desulfovibrionales bacterium]
MSWSARIAGPGRKELAKLDRKARSNILNFLRKRIATDEDPRRFGNPLRHNLTGLWKYRVDAFRVIADIQDQEVTVLIVRVGHKSKVYGEY